MTFGIENQNVNFRSTFGQHLHQKVNFVIFKQID